VVILVLSKLKRFCTVKLTPIFSVLDVYSSYQHAAFGARILPHA